MDKIAILMTKVFGRSCLSVLKVRKKSIATSVGWEQIQLITQ